MICLHRQEHTQYDHMLHSSIPVQEYDMILQYVYGAVAVEYWNADQH